MIEKLRDSRKSVRWWGGDGAAKVCVARGPSSAGVKLRMWGGWRVGGVGDARLFFRGVLSKAIFSKLDIPRKYERFRADTGFCLGKRR